MERIQCEICGGTNISKIGEDVFECQDCGIQYSRQEAMKLIVCTSAEQAKEEKIDTMVKNVHS